MSKKVGAKPRRKQRSNADSGRNGAIGRATPTGDEQLPAEAIIEQRATYSGPIPPPEALRRYDEILPGAADRILGMAEAFGEHDREVTKRALALDEFIQHSNSDAKRRGQWMAFGLMLLSLGLAGAGAFLDRPEIFGFFSKATLGGLALIALAFIGDRLTEKLLSSRRRADTESGEEGHGP